MMLIIIPTYNEKHNLEKLVKGIFNLGNLEEKIEVLIIDDNSPDGTGQIAEELSLKYPLKVIHRSRKMGLGSAYITGFKFALSQGVTLVMTMDADFSHQPGDLPQFIRAIGEGFELVVGSRRVPLGKIIGWNWWRRFASWAAMGFSRWALGLETKDVTSGFRCYKRKVLEDINLDQIKSNGYAFQEEMIYFSEKKGFKIKEIPISFIDREQGKSKLSWLEIIKFLVTIFRLKSKELLK